MSEEVQKDVVRDVDLEKVAPVAEEAEKKPEESAEPAAKRSRPADEITEEDAKSEGAAKIMAVLLMETEEKKKLAAEVSTLRQQQAEFEKYQAEQKRLQQEKQENLKKEVRTLLDSWEEMAKISSPPEKVEREKGVWENQFKKIVEHGSPADLEDFKEQTAILVESSRGQVSRNAQMQEEFHKAAQQMRQEADARQGALLWQQWKSMQGPPAPAAMPPTPAPPPSLPPSEPVRALDTPATKMAGDIAPPPTSQVPPEMMQEFIASLGAQGKKTVWSPAWAARAERKIQERGGRFAGWHKDLMETGFEAVDSIGQRSIL